MEALKELRALYLAENRRKFPALPEACRFAPAYTDKTANGLTKMIIDFLKLNGWQAERIAVTGRYIDNIRIVTDVTGRQRKIGSGRWIKGSMQKGSADISAVIQGRAVKIEIKMPGDRQSEAQKRYQQQIEKAGGVYIIATNFDQFTKWYYSFIQG